MDIARLIAERPAAQILSCAADMPVRRAVELLAHNRIGAVPVTEGGRVVGIFSERDAVYRLAEEGALCLDRALREVMTAPPITVTGATSVLDALGLMTRRRIRHLPVLEGDTLVGFVSIGDLVKARLDAIQFEAEAMREYIRTA